MLIGQPVHTRLPLVSVYLPDSHATHALRPVASPCCTQQRANELSYRPQSTWQHVDCIRVMSLFAGHTCHIITHNCLKHIDHTLELIIHMITMHCYMIPFLRDTAHNLQSHWRWRICQCHTQCSCSSQREVCADRGHMAHTLIVL